jgi:hypothetical protein
MPISLLAAGAGALQALPALLLTPVEWALF